MGSHTVHNHWMYQILYGIPYSAQSLNVPDPIWDPTQCTLTEFTRSYMGSHTVHSHWIYQIIYGIPYSAQSLNLPDHIWDPIECTVTEFTRSYMGSHTVHSHWMYQMGSHTVHNNWMYQILYGIPYSAQSLNIPDPMFHFWPDDGSL